MNQKKVLISLTVLASLVLVAALISAGTGPGGWWAPTDGAESAHVSPGDRAPASPRTESVTVAWFDVGDHGLPSIVGGAHEVLPAEAFTIDDENRTLQVDGAVDPAATNAALILSSEQDDPRLLLLHDEYVELATTLEDDEEGPGLEAYLMDGFTDLAIAPSPCELATGSEDGARLLSLHEPGEVARLGFSGSPACADLAWEVTHLGVDWAFR